jgi:hypothetical protein
MKTKLIFSGIVLIWLMACNPSAQKDETSGNDVDTTGQACAAPSERNPNGASELAQLMRVMEAQAETWKKEVSENAETLSPVPRSFSTLKTAKVTKPSMKNENFDAFADDFVRFSEALVAAPREKRTEAYNAMVNGCANCHSQMCPGPLVRIKKFYL